MSEKQAQEQTKTTEDKATVCQVPDGKPLSEQDLDAVAGGAARRGPGTQTEDDAFVG